MAKRKRKAKKAKVNKLVVFCGVVIMTLAVLITLADKITLPFYVPTWDELSSMVNPQAQLDEEGRTHLEVHAIDVGQGDSIYIKAGSKNILIDAGENDQGPTVSKYLRELGVDRLDLVVGTHPHSDHIGGWIISSNSLRFLLFCCPRCPKALRPPPKPIWICWKPLPKRV